MMNAGMSEGRLNMRRWLWLIPTAILLLAGYFVIETPFEDKVYSNPIGEDVVALEFRLADGSAGFRLEDADAIDKLRKAYRWTNYHMYCCLGYDEIYACVYEVTDGTRRPAEPMKVYNSLDIPSFNLKFRLLLKKVCDQTVNN